MRLLNDGFSTNIIMPECQVAEPALNQKEESSVKLPSLPLSSMHVFKTFLLFGEVEVVEVSTYKTGGEQ
uniref:Uncharacterized protein n=1 Tax=Zea mays TaxID=4577 RepID=A0A804P6N5_MAIZE